MRISDWSSDVCSSDLADGVGFGVAIIFGCGLGLAGSGGGGGTGAACGGVSVMNVTIIVGATGCGRAGVSCMNNSATNPATCSAAMPPNTTARPGQHTQPMRE